MRREQCRRYIKIGDTDRRRRRQCNRAAVKDGLCYQHQPGYLTEMLAKRSQRKLGRPEAG